MPGTARAVPPGTVIDNSAQAAFRAWNTDLTQNSNTVSLVTVWPRTASQIELLQYAPALAGAPQYALAPTGYDPDGVIGGATIQISAIHPAGSASAIDLDNPVPLVPAALFHQGEPVFVRVTDADQNINPGLAETIWVQVSAPALSDSELLLLTETGPDSGIFMGCIQSNGLGPAQPYNGVLDVTEGDQLSARYTDMADSGDTALQSALVDPYGLVFDSATGQPVDNVQLTLLTDAGTPATVYGDDGVSSFPATISSGGTFIDSSGKVYTFSGGHYRFPFVAPGTYRLRIQPPAGYAAPSSVATAVLQSLPGGPFVIAEPGSRGEPFVLNPGPAVRLDVPVDPDSSGLWLSKSANQTVAAIGDFVQYTVMAQNNTGTAAAGVQIFDRLPAGFRYRRGSARLNGLPLDDPQVSTDGRSLTFAAGDLPDGATAEIRYVTEISAGAKPGPARNSASAASMGGRHSNVAFAQIEIKQDLWRTENILVGRVIADNCDKRSEAGGDGVAGVRIYLEDGTYVITDPQGRYHFEGVTAGSHVVQLDLETLPDGYTLSDCERNARTAGTPFSRFVDLQGGTLWRVDFHLQSKPPPSGQTALELSCGLEGKTVHYQGIIDVRSVDIGNMRLSVMLPDGSDYVTGSSRRNGAALDDPQNAGNVLTYRLGDGVAGGQQTLAFSVRLTGNAQPGRLHTKALLTFDTPDHKNQRTEVIDTVLALKARTLREVQTPIVVRPQFGSLSAELGGADRRMLDRLVARLQGVEVDHVVFSGHTDNRPVKRPRQGKYVDNLSLARARAESVAHYLAAKLRLKPPQITIVAKGDREPVASNATAAGRALNRRVEVTIMSARVQIIHDLASIKCQDQAAVETRGRYAAGTPVRAAILAEPEVLQDFESIDLEALKPGFALLVPDKDFHPGIPSIKIAVQHDPAERLNLLLNDRPVSALNFDGRRANKAHTVAVSFWRGVDLAPGQNRLLIIRKDSSGREVGRLQRTIHYAGPPAHATLVQEASRLTADGREAPVIVVRLTDREGQPVRPGVVGEFEVLPPFAPQEAQPSMEEGLPRNPAEKQRYTVGGDGLARIRLKPTTQTGEAVVRFKLSDRQAEVRAWLQPGARNWILVGLAEGTLGYSEVSGHLENLEAADLPEDYYQDGRLAFFAKGRIKGQWLLTAAYDSARDRNDPRTRLFQTLDPDAYYTLYGDASEQNHEAPSIRKLYLKIERQRFYALFGDFDTGLNVTELSRYSRRFNGLKSEYHGDRYGLTLFATETNQAFIKDELRGDGTSGLYHLSRRNILANSEKVTLETRDRFHSEVILTSRSLVRHLDYTIDYEAGTLFFKSPVYSRDENFNPNYIVVDYESADAADEAPTYGGRGSAKLLDGRMEVGATYVHEGPKNGEGDLGGLDASMDMGRGIKVKAEVAATRRQEGGDALSGQAYLAEVGKSSADLDARLYYREQGRDFGLGQQNGSEAETRKVGADASWRFKPDWTVSGEIYRNDNLATGAQRDVGEARLAYSQSLYQLYSGLRLAEDRLGDGRTNRSSQLLLGASRRFWQNRLQLRLTHEQSLGDENQSVDFPTRTILGADYKLTDKVSTFAEHEITQGDEVASQSSRAGLKATPWSGGQLGTSIGRQIGENADRLFANLGLYQTWQIGRHWSLDAGLDRTQTVRESGQTPFNVNVPSAAGTEEDFTAVSLGAGYRAEKWSWTARLETRLSDTCDKQSLISGVAGEVRSGLGLSAGLQLLRTEAENGTDSLDGDLRLSLAYRPGNARWIVFDRLEYKVQNQKDSASRTDSSRIINNFNANYKPADQWQLALQYGAKYVFDTIDGEDFAGFTDLTGLELRYDLTSRWDLGLQASVLHSWQPGQFDYRSGLSVGYALFKNTWISLGYNFDGFKDPDFSAADYTAQGPYLKFRLKFDQQSVRRMVDWFSRSDR